MKSFVMKNGTVTLLKHFLIYGLLGLIAEVIYTGLASLLAGDFSMHGFTFLIMLPIYGLAVFLEPFVIFLKPLPWWIRGLFYIVSFWLIEYITGILLLAILGNCPWNYKDPLNINGLITLRMAPEWFIAGLGFERVYHFLQINEI